MGMKTKGPGRPAKFTYSDKDGVRHLVKGRQRVACFLPADVVKKLKLIGVMEGREFSDVITEALERFVRNHKALRNTV